MLLGYVEVMLLFASLAFAQLSEEPAFPERMPGLVETCLIDAVDSDEVSITDESHKYMCVGNSAAALWTFLEKSGVPSFEQTPADEDTWLSREFPLGGCFKRVKMRDGSALKSGLSCTIWIPRKKS